MARVITRKVGDARPLVAHLKNADGSPKDLTGSTVVINLRERKTGAAGVAGGACEITDAANGIVSYGWAAGGNDRAGLFLCDFQETLVSGGAPYPYPSDGYDYVRFIDTAAPTP